MATTIKESLAAHNRAKHLRALIDELSKFRDDALAENGIDLASDPPVIPHRFAASEHDGSESYMAFYDSVEEANAGAAASIQTEYPWAPWLLVDLDTGNRYDAEVTVAFKPLAWAVDARVTWFDTARLEKYRFESEDAANRYLANVGDSVKVVRGPYFDFPHPQVPYGKCSICGHHGEDCLGEANDDA